MYYDRQGNPMTMMAWSEKFSDREYQRVAWTDIGDVAVSTVWLGLDHQWDPHGTPIIFETMVFGGQFDQWCERYPTEGGAIAGHDQLVAKVRNESKTARTNSDRT